MGKNDDEPGDAVRVVVWAAMMIVVIWVIWSICASGYTPY